MEFSCSVEIEESISIVQQLFEDPENMQHWQDGFISYTHLNGEVGAVGSQTLYKYKIGKRTLELTETILVNNLPKEFKGSFECEPMTNELSCHLIPINPQLTRLEQHVKYTQFNGTMTRFMAWLFPGVFQRSTQKWLDQFKAFVESKPLS